MEQTQENGEGMGNYSSPAWAAKGKAAVWIIAVLVIIAVGAYFFSSGSAKPDISGAWQSVAAENIGSGSYATRQFNITGDKWSLDFTAYGDQAKTYPLFKFHGEGPYAIGDPSIVVPGAYNAIFNFSKKELTLLASDPKVSAQLGFDSCGLTVGSAADISASGCSFFPSVSNCAQEYDLVKRDGDTFTLGARPADNNLCAADKRPTALGYPLGKR